jgi:DNA-binding beta-propeller fold protein YncE
MLRFRSAILAVSLAAPWPAAAQLAVSANDGHTMLTDAGTQVPADPIAPDTVTILDLSANPPKVLGEVQAPASVVGPPQAVAIAPDESFALVTSSTKVEGGKIVPDDRVSVIDLKASPPKVRATLQAGKGAAGVSLNRAGTLALVANRAEGTLSVFTVAQGEVKPAGKIEFGNEKSGPSLAVFTRDGREAYVTRDGDYKISVLSVDGDKVAYTKRDISAGMRPYGIEMAPSGDIAIAANIGTSSGDHDTVSIIDLKARPSRVVNTVTVGPTPEGIRISPDGRHLAVINENGSNLAKTSPFYSDKGQLRVFRIEGFDLAKVAEAPIGRWCQGAAWSRDGATLIVQCMVDREIQVFRFDGKALERKDAIKLSAGGASLRTVDP